MSRFILIIALCWVTILLLDSASANPSQWQQHQINVQRGQQFTRDHQNRYYNQYGNSRQREINRQQQVNQDPRSNAGYRFGQWLVGKE